MTENAQPAEAGLNIVPMDSSPGRRISVVGNGGKTTLSKILAEKTGLAYIELDALYWKPGWGESSAEELMEKVGAELGLDVESARALTLQTALGAARMALESGDSPDVLRKRVTSPGGTTEQAVNSFIDGGVEDLVRRALEAARDRGVELGKQLGDC